MGSAFSALHLPAALALSCSESSKIERGNFQALVSQCKTFLDHSPEAATSIMMYDPKFEMAPQVFVDITFDSTAHLRTSTAEAPFLNCSFGHYFCHQREIFRLLNMIKASLQEGRYSEYLLEKHKCGLCASVSPVSHRTIDANFDQDILVDALLQPEVESEARCACDQIICPPLETLRDANLCELHGIYLNGINCTKNSLGWEIFFSENPGLSRFSNARLVVPGLHPLPILDDSSLFDINFEHSGDGSFKLSVDVDFEMDHSPSSQLGECPWLLHGEDGESDEYETSSDGSDETYSKDDDGSQSEGDIIYDDGDEFAGGSYHLISLDYADERVGPTTAFDYCAGNLSGSSTGATGRHSKYHQCCSHPRVDIARTECSSRPSNKRVVFAAEESLVTVHHMVAWNHAYRESRKTYWETFVNDRAHFKRRVLNLSEILEPVLQKKLEQILRTTEADVRS